MQSNQQSVSFQPLAFLFQSLALLCCVALIAFLPSWHFMPKVIVWHHDAQRLLELILLGLVLLSTVFNGQPLYSNSHKHSTFNPKNRIVYYALSAFFILAIFSACLAQSPRHAIIEVCLFVALSYLAVFIARLYIKNKDVFIKRLIYVVWAGILLYLVAFYVGYITAIIFKTRLQWPHPFTGFSNIRTFNQYQLWSLGLVSLPLLAFDLKISTRRWLYIALTFWWVLLFYSASRGVLIAWFIGLVVTVTIYRKLAIPFLRSQAINIVTGFSAYLLLFKVVPMLRESALVTGTILRESASGRIELWQQALTLTKGSPWFGVGPMHYAWHNLSNAHPHNSVLQLAAEFGLPATFLILAIAVYGIYCWQKKFNLKELKTTNKLNKNLTVVLFFTLASNAAYSLVDGVIVMPLSQVMMFTMIGVCLGHYAAGNTLNMLSNTSVIQRKLNLSAVLASAILVTLTWSTAPEISQGLSGHENNFSTMQPASGPRLWRQFTSRHRARAIPNIN